jgi:hypothetical protein
MDREAAATGRTLVCGAGFGVLATESILLHLLADEEKPSRVRVDAVASVAIEPGALGEALAATIVHALLDGGREVRQGRMARARAGGIARGRRSDHSTVAASAVLAE